MHTLMSACLSGMFATLHRRDLAVRYSAGSVQLYCKRSSGMFATCIDGIWLSGTQRKICSCPAHAHVGLLKWHVCNLHRRDLAVRYSAGIEPTGNTPVGLMVVHDTKMIRLETAETMSHWKGNSIESTTPTGVRRNRCN